MSAANEWQGGNARDPSWFFEQAKARYRPARQQEDLGDARQRETYHFLYHRAIELALKAALISEKLWDGHTADYRIHDLSALCEPLAAKRLAAFADLWDSIIGPPVHQVRRAGEGPCETSIEVGYADNVEWEEVRGFREVAERTLSVVARECGFAYP